MASRAQRVCTKRLLAHLAPPSSRAKSTGPASFTGSRSGAHHGATTASAVPAPLLSALLGHKALTLQGLLARTSPAGTQHRLPFPRRFVFLPNSACDVMACTHKAKGISFAGNTGRAMSSDSGSDDVIIYSSKFESVLRAFSAGSIAQGAACSLMAAAVSLHPAAANSSLLPGWTAGGRGALSGLLLGFGAAVVLGCKGFLSKQILKVATIPNAPDDINIYMLSFPFGSSVHRVPKKEFYVITASFGEFDLDKEAEGPAPILPVYVGGTVKQTLMIDVRGEFLDKSAMAEIMVAPPQNSGGDWDAQADEILKKPFIPNRVKKDI